MSDHYLALVDPTADLSNAQRRADTIRDASTVVSATRLGHDSTNPTCSRMDARTGPRNYDTGTCSKSAVCSSTSVNG